MWATKDELGAETMPPPSDPVFNVGDVVVLKYSSSNVGEQYRVEQSFSDGGEGPTYNDRRRRHVDGTSLCGEYPDEDYEEEEQDTLFTTTQPNSEHHIPLTVNARHNDEHRAYLRQVRDQNALRIHEEINTATTVNMVNDGRRRHADGTNIYLQCIYFI